MDQLHQELKLKLGEQLTGLSPTVCRRVIAAIRRWLATTEEHTGYVDEPAYISACISLLAGQTSVGDGYRRSMHGKHEVAKHLTACERFLDIVEGKEPAATEPGTPPEE